MITKQYYKRALGAFAVYNITHRPSFVHLQGWINKIYENCSQDILIVIVGNKSDLTPKREVSYQEGYNFAEKYALPFFETSAKNNSNI